MGSGRGQATLGVQPHITDRTMPVGEVARLAAERGFASMFVCEHTHIPVASKSLSPRGLMPDWCKHIPDPYITLAAVAATTDLEIGTAVSLAAEHDPIVLAKAIATLDQLSGGRFVFGVGWGWCREEYEDHTGLPPGTRVQVLRDKLRLMQRIWADDEAAYDGTYARLQASWSWPKPTRPSGPPVLLGVKGEARNYARIAEWTDGWIPMGSALRDDAFATEVAELRRIWAEAGRDPDGPDITILQQPGSADDLRRDLDRADEIGVRRVLIQIDEETMADAEAVLDRAAVVIPGR
jgi:probable F420-dependent oxidoreductase